ncbi:Hsp20/alpha crystallin family protein [Virgibacillus sp. 179-BFC.A HS]|uniref:Hsp20/alpha crystallin family protein n=1 Tax=Tigheibacillus jepli TaxID=3035914 RepID=A0ABU5CLW0_9BACI|nr:Hsp20/alpha crystallin family protein [Virgibacillus sp. 179-BFC.A HS]MDY0406450.1 Hsp20/alpha crystallin family protein [Virgibacillus sp. 179-BFC.A HS]
MAFAPMDPFRQLSNMRREFDNFFSNVPSMFQGNYHMNAVRADVHETDQEVVATFDVPGLEKKDDIQIEVNNNVLKLSGTIHKSSEIKEEDMYRKERYQGKFSRMLELPAAVSDEDVKATYKNGVLEVRMPKTKNESTKKIDVDFQ